MNWNDAMNELEKLMVENQDVLFRMKDGVCVEKETMFEVRRCVECGALPCFEVVGDRKGVFCPVCGGLHHTSRAGATWQDAVRGWNEGQEWIAESMAFEDDGLEEVRSC